MKTERVVGGVFGLVAFAAILGVGLVKGVGLGDTVLRAVCGLAVGVLLGWGLFGPLGTAVTREAAAPEQADEKKETGGEPSSPPEEK